MINDTAEVLVNHYGEILKQEYIDEREFRTFSYWVTSTIASAFWSGRLRMEANLYVNNGSAILEFENPSNADKEIFKYTCHYTALTERLLNRFKDYFHNINYNELVYKHVYFRAYGISKEESEKSPYFGYYHVTLVVNMNTNCEDYGHKYAQ